jgi:2,3-bisphosphoglycerate-dependent phosphoglycerate mutase
MKLFFVRHGQSENNALWANTQSNVNRVPDPQLTEVGRKQVEVAADFLKAILKNETTEYNDQLFKYEGEDIHIYCSLMERAIQSGLIISKILSLPLKAHLDIHENGGLYLDDPLTTERTGVPGKNPEDLKITYPDLILPEGINSYGWWNRPFEERETRRMRARRVLNDLKAYYGNSNTILILIIHGGFYNYLLRAALDLRDDTEVWFDLFNAAITFLEISDNFINLIYCNRYDFIPRELVT